MNKIDKVRSINESTTIIKTKIKMGKQIIWEIGEELEYIKQNKTYKQLNYGSFKEYVENELDISSGYARKYISIYNKFERSPENAFDSLGISKLYLLGQVDDPKERKALAEKDLSKRELRDLIKMVDTSVNPVLKEMVMNDEINNIEEFEYYKELFQDVESGDFDYLQIDDPKVRKSMRESAAIIKLNDKLMKIKMENNFLEIEKVFLKDSKADMNDMKAFLKHNNILELYEDYKENGELDINLLLEYVLDSVEKDLSLADNLEEYVAEDDQE